MSMIAVLLVLQTAPAGGVTVTAEQALAAHRAATSIGPDPCRPGAAAGDEIVVCGRRESPYALPLYDPTDDDDASKYGGNRVGQMAAVKESESACAKQGAFCQPPPLFNALRVIEVLVKGAKALADDE